MLDFTSDKLSELLEVSPGLGLAVDGSGVRAQGVKDCLKREVEEDRLGARTTSNCAGNKGLPTVKG